MANSFDRRIVPDSALALVRSLQQRVDCHLGGGAALSGIHLHHRLSRDLDLFCHDAAAVRELVRVLPDVARETGTSLRVVRDAGTAVRAAALIDGRDLELDLLLEGTPDLDPPAFADGVVTESLADLRAAKITCILSRSEPRDLEEDLLRFRDDLRDRFKKSSLP